MTQCHVCFTIVYIDCKSSDIFIINCKIRALTGTVYIYLFYQYCNAFDLGGKHNDNTV